MTFTRSSVIEKATRSKLTSHFGFFFQRWLSNPLAVGSIMPSSPGLCALVQKQLGYKSDEIVVEYGPGTGAITRAILDAGVPAERLYSIEIDPELVKYMTHEFPEVTVIHGDVRHSDSLIGSSLVGQVGTVIVGIPMVLLPFEQQQEIIAAIFRILKSGRHFLLFTYCITSPLSMKALHLRGKRLGWTPWNFPPASLWAYESANT